MNPFKGILLLLSLLCSAFDGRAQNVDHWQVGIFSGLTTPLHDIRRAEWVSNGDLRYQLGAEMNYWRNSTWGLRLQLSRGEVQGKVLDSTYLARLAFPGGFSSLTTFTDVSLQAQLSLTGLANQLLGRQREQQRLHCYTALGLGVNQFEVLLRNMATGLAVYDSLGIPSKGRARSVPVSLGLSYKVQPNFHINLQATMHYLHTDIFDGWSNDRLGDTEPVFGRGFDRFATAHLAFVFLLGKGESAYWKP